MGRAQHRRGVGTDGEEGDVAEVEQAGLADDDVEPEGHQHVDARPGRRARWRSRSRACRRSADRHDREQVEERRSERDDGDHAADVGRWPAPLPAEPLAAGWRAGGRARRRRG